MRTQLGMLLTAKFPTCIGEITWDCPAKGQFLIEGSIPISCYDQERRMSKLYATLDDARKAIESAGVKRYQLPDCSWNQ